MLTGGRGDIWALTFEATGFVFKLLPHAYTCVKRERYLKRRASANYPNCRLNIHGEPIVYH